MVRLQPGAGVPQSRPVLKISRLSSEKGSASGGTRSHRILALVPSPPRWSSVSLGVGLHPVDAAAGQIDLQVEPCFCVPHLVPLLDFLLNSRTRAPTRRGSLTPPDSPWLPRGRASGLQVSKVHQWLRARTLPRCVPYHTPAHRAPSTPSWLAAQSGTRQRQGHRIRGTVYTALPLLTSGRSSSAIGSGTGPPDSLVTAP